MIRILKNISNNKSILNNNNNNIIYLNIKNNYCTTTTTITSTSTPSNELIDYTKLIPKDGNIPNNIKDKIGKDLHNQPNHPLNIIKKKIQYHFQNQLSDSTHQFQFFDKFEPKVTTKQNFDDLLFPNNHVGRSPNDTYYFNETQLLRTHTSAHQSEILNQKDVNAFLVTGDVYRRDTIDSVHYPVFHQMEGVKVFKGRNEFKFDPSIDYYKDEQYKNLNEIKQVEQDLKRSLETMIRGVIGQDLQVRWIDAYFPFTSPSYEMEILFQGQWLEVLGCGVVHPAILDHTGLKNDRAWAFGIGLERLAMILFNIPDIRLFWTQDKRFLNQFNNVDKDINALTNINIKNVQFQPFSKYPSCFKDISFWIGDDFHENKFYEFVRETCGDLVEKVDLVDNFNNKKLNKTSHCYRIQYRSMDRNLTNDEIDEIQLKLRSKVEESLNVKLR